MKLRNKKTGEIMQGLELSVIEYGFGHEWMRDWSYNSIKAFLEDWEDVKENSPAEPLIKDEKIRKAVRAWAEVLGANEVEFYGDRKWLGFRTKLIGSEYPSSFELNYSGSKNTLVAFKTYTIAELCGEDDND